MEPQRNGENTDPANTGSSNTNSANRAPENSRPENTGTENTDPEDNGPENTTPVDTGNDDPDLEDPEPENTATRDIEPENIGKEDTDPEPPDPDNTNPVSTSPEYTSPEEPYPRSTLKEATEPGNTRRRIIHWEDTNPESTAPGNTSPEEPYPQSTDPADTEPDNTGPRTTGSEDTGPEEPYQLSPLPEATEPENTRPRTIRWEDTSPESTAEPYPQGTGTTVPEPDSENAGAESTGQENADPGVSRTEDTPRESTEPEISYPSEYPHTDATSENSYTLMLREEMKTITSGRSTETRDSSTDSEIYKMYHQFRRSSKIYSDRSLSNEGTFVYMTIPPDGGYGWVILVIAFCCQAIVDGILFTIGVILPHIASDMSLSNKQTAFIASTQIGVFFLAAPISSAFINNYGFRPVALTGALVSSGALLIGSFSQNIAMLVLFCGLIAGTAMGMLWMTTTLVINYYFERYRSLASGVATSGSGLGMILISTINFQLVDIIGWRNVVRMHGLILFIAGLLVLTYKEVTPTKIGTLIDFLSDDETTDDSVEIASNRYSFNIPPKADSKIFEKITGPSRANLRFDIISSSEIEVRERSYFHQFCPCCVRKANLPILRQSTSRRYIISHDVLDRDDIFYDGVPDYNRTSKDIAEMKKVELLREIENNRTRSVHYTLSVMRSCSDEYLSVSKRYKPKIRAALRALFDLQLVSIPEFQMLAMAAFFYPLGFNVPFMFSAKRAKIDHNIAAMLPVLIGLTNIVTRISVGVIAYTVKFHTAYVAGGGIVLGGLATFISAFVGERSIAFQLSYVVCFGISAASYVTLRAVIYVKVLGLERLTNTFGLNTLVMGVSAFIGTNIAGILNDHYGNYSPSFAFSGVCITIAGVLYLCLPRFMVYRKTVETRKSQKKVRFAGVNTRKMWWRKCCDCCF